MSDNKNMRDGRDDVKVDSKDPSEVEFVHKQFPNLTHQQVMDAIKQYGPYRKDIYAALEKMR